MVVDYLKRPDQMGFFDNVDLPSVDSFALQTMITRKSGRLARKKASGPSKKKKEKEKKPLAHVLVLYANVQGYNPCWYNKLQIIRTHYKLFYSTLHTPSYC